MTIQDVINAIDSIKLSVGDNEGAHLMEDDLWGKVLQAIADGTAEDPAEMARLALTTNDIEFDRWYA